jgi:hypothetical protein
MNLLGSLAAKISRSDSMLAKLIYERGRGLLWAVAVIAVCSIYIYFAGSAVVVDETRGVDIVVIVGNDGKKQHLYELWGGFFYAVPRLEGQFEVRCYDGSRYRSGYVARYLHSELRVTGSTLHECQRKRAEQL